MQITTSLEQIVMERSDHTIASEDADEFYVRVVGVLVIIVVGVDVN